MYNRKSQQIRRYKIWEKSAKAYLVVTNTDYHLDTTEYYQENNMASIFFLLEKVHF